MPRLMASVWKLSFVESLNTIYGRSLSLKKQVPHRDGYKYTQECFFCQS